MNTLLDAALHYRQMDYSIVPVRADKSCACSWTRYQKTLMELPEITRFFNRSSVAGIAVVGGEISNHLEAIDLDVKYDLTGKLFDSFLYRINHDHPGLFDRLVVTATRNHGYHLSYRCPQAGRNTILARRPATEDEIRLHPQEKVKVLAETRANGGYLIVPPTPGYRFIQRDLDTISVITPEERMALFTVARSFNTYIVQPSQTLYSPWLFNRHESPFYDYNDRGDLFGLLECHGWTRLDRKGPRTYFRRPGHTLHYSSGDYHHDLGLFGVFSTSTEFEPGRGYRPSAVYTILECDGDFKLSARRLLAEGFGIPYRRREDFFISNS